MNAIIAAALAFAWIMLWDYLMDRVDRQIAKLPTWAFILLFCFGVIVVVATYILAPWILGLFVLAFLALNFLRG